MCNTPDDSDDNDTFPYSNVENACQLTVMTRDDSDDIFVDIVITVITVSACHRCHHVSSQVASILLVRGQNEGATGGAFHLFRFDAPHTNEVDFLIHLARIWQL